MEAFHARIVSMAEGEGCLPDDFRAFSFAGSDPLRFSSRLSVSDRRVHGETRTLRKSPWKPLRPIIVRLVRHA